jgi:beta-galactosidase GanA
MESRSVPLPALTGWKSGNSLPETNPTYDDSKWTVCNKNTTLSPVAPLTLPVLFSSDYGFYTGAKVYRDYLMAFVNLTTSGGLAFGFNAWLNVKLIGGSPGNASLTTIASVQPFSGATLKPKDNVLTVVVGYHSHDETSPAHGVENPCGILSASLSYGIFTQWKIQGNAGGSASIDPVRSPMNEGGLYGERQGWHLPGFDTSKLPSTSIPMDGLTQSGIRFYVTTFHLNIDSDLGAPLGIELSARAGTVARVMIWVNG